MSSFDHPRALVPDLIAQHGRWLRGKPAVVEGSRQLDWQAFDEATNRIANGLGALGLAPGARVAILMGNSIEMAQVLFGAGKAGVSAVPLNITVNDAAIAAMIADSGAGAVVASGEHCRRIEALLAEKRLPPSLVRLGVDPPGPEWLELTAFRDAQSSNPPAVRIGPDTECNIIYSSGTTALPKGIVHSHQCRAHWANDLALALRYHSGAVTLCSLGLYSNISWVAMLATILVGGTLVIMPSFSAPGVIEHVRRYRITHGAFVPVQLQRLLDCPEFDAQAFGSLQTIMCCGSPLPVPVKRATRDRLGCELIELYGLTEGLVTTLSPQDFDRKIESVGKPIPGQQIRIIGNEDVEVGPDEAGEIVGLGRLAMERYHNREDATRDATWIDPEGRRWLRTGDIGRVDADGFLYLVDRKKDLILSGGQNVYPADIEIVMREHPAVAEVAVIGVPDGRWGETPLAVVVTRASHRADAHDLLRWTNERVGKQQRVSSIVFREALPRNPNGKILKRELRDEYSRG